MSPSNVEIEVTTSDNKSAKATFVIDDRGDYIQRKIFEQKDFYERPLLNFVQSVARDKPLFIDVGANIGNHTVFMGTALGAKVIAVEPNRPNFERLCRNVQASGFADRFQAHNVAVGASTGVVKSVMTETVNTGGAKVAACESGETGAVPLTTLDSLVGPVGLGNFSDIVVKIDVEGMEIEVLKGMTRIFSDFRPLVVIEVFSDKNINMVRQMLGKKGYMPIATFFKQPTFVLAPKERVPELVDKMAPAAWTQARSYIDYCRIFRQVALSKTHVDALAKLYAPPPKG